MIPTLSRYILRETVGSWLAVTAVLTVILLTNQLGVVLARAAEQGFPPGVVLTLVGLGTVQNISVLLPIGLLLGVMLALGRLYHDSEMTAMQACGVSGRHTWSPVLLIAIVCATVVGFLTSFVGPMAMAKIQEVRSEALRDGEFSPITAGRFRNFGGGSIVLYAETLDANGMLGNVFIQRDNEGRQEIMLADRGQHTISSNGRLHLLTLYSGERIEGTPGSAELRRVRFEQSVIPVQIPEALLAPPRLEAQPFFNLLRSEELEAIAEWQWRVAAPVMVLVLAMLAVPLARLRPRQGRYARIWLGVVLYFLYFSLISAARVWLEKGLTPAWLGLWWVHFVVLGAAWLALTLPTWRERWRHRGVAA
ncbi:MAG: LPS export ABC transporter permease LptF [Steroidobacteraceae bacterium]